MNTLYEENILREYDGKTKVVKATVTKIKEDYFGINIDGETVGTRATAKDCINFIDECYEIVRDVDRTWKAKVRTIQKLQEEIDNIESMKEDLENEAEALRLFKIKQIGEQ